MKAAQSWCWRCIRISGIKLRVWRRPSVFMVTGARAVHGEKSSLFTKQLDAWRATQRPSGALPPAGHKTTQKQSKDLNVRAKTVRRGEHTGVLSGLWI